MLRWFPALFGLSTAGLAAAVVGALAAPPPVSAAAPLPPAGAQTGAQSGAGFVGSETCAGCHEVETASHRVSVHVQTEDDAGPARGCEACHGPGEAHVEALGDPSLILSFDDPARGVAEKVAVCLNCHQDHADNSAFRSSPHMKGAVDCASCHKPHAAAAADRLLPRAAPGDLRLGAGLEACLGCHQEVRAETNLNERHRMLEGMVTCADCHAPHDPSPRARLGGFAQETCIGCHTDKGGPFVFEHLGQRVDGCTSCHRPHGSTNRHMLEFQRVGDLCYSCHVEVPSFHRGFGPPTIQPRFDSSTNCTNCHSAIHGSNLDHAFLQ